MHLPCKCIRGKSEFIINMSKVNETMGLVKCFSIILTCNLKILKVHGGCRSINPLVVKDLLNMI